MTARKINEIMEGNALLESCGNLYEYIGHDKKQRLIFQNVNDDSHFAISYEELMQDRCYQIQY